VIQVQDEAAYHRGPFDSLPQADKECLLAKTVTEHSVCQWGKNIKDDGHSYEDLPRRDVVLVDFIGEKTDEHIVRWNNPHVSLVSLGPQKQQLELDLPRVSGIADAMA
jgi:hypothetical protein